MDQFSFGDLTISARDRGIPTPLQFFWKGRSNDRHPGRTLAPFFGHVLSEGAGGKRNVEIHFEELEHFNSSTITALIQLIQDARQQEVRLTLIYKQTLKWQKLSFDALRVFVKGDDLFQITGVS